MDASKAPVDTEEAPMDSKEAPVNSKEVPSKAAVSSWAEEVEDELATRGKTQASALSAPQGAKLDQHKASKKHRVIIVDGSIGPGPSRDMTGQRQPMGSEATGSSGHRSGSTKFPSFDSQYQGTPPPSYSDMSSSHGPGGQQSYWSPQQYRPETTQAHRQYPDYQSPAPQYSPQNWKATGGTRAHDQGDQTGSRDPHGQQDGPRHRHDMSREDNRMDMKPHERNIGNQRQQLPSPPQDPASGPSRDAPQRYDRSDGPQ